MRHFLPALGLAALLAVPAIAHHDGDTFQKSGLVISHAHTDEPSPSAHSIHVYMTVENTGDAADRLVAASVPFAAAGRFEANVLGADGVLTVATVPAIAIEPGQTVSMEPGSIRIVFDDVKRTISAGEHFDMTLTFENAGTVEVEVEIEEAHEHEGAAS
jgi:copper(I)-binding protein